MNAASQKPRLLVLASTYPRWPNDSEPGFVHELARRLVDAFEVTVITPHAYGAAQRERIDGVDIVRYRYAPEALETLVHGGGIMTHLRRSPWKLLLVPGFVLMQWKAVRCAIIRQRPAIIHAHWLLPQGVVARLLASCGVPYVLTSHGADLFALRGRLFTRCRRWVIARAAAVSVVSEAMRAQLQRECPEANIAVMPMGVDAQQLFTPDAATRRADNELLFVGRLVEKKGLGHLIAAMPEIIAQRPGTILSIAGFGPLEASLRAQAESLGLTQVIRFLGAVAQKELPALYRRATLFVAPFVQAAGGDQEGLGLVVAEAMACACPVIVGDVAGVKDLVDDSCALVVDSTNHSSISKAILTLLDDMPKRAQLAAAGRTQVVARFDWAGVAARYADFLKDAASTLPHR